MTSNPLMNRQPSSVAFGREGVVHTKAERGTDEALQQLRDHCAFLNEHELRDVEWFVTGEPGSRTISNRPRFRGDAA